MKSMFIASILGLFCLVGCADRQTAEVKKVFDRAVEGFLPYAVAGVSGYEVKSYEIVQYIGELVVVRITFGSKAGTDLVVIKKFQLGSDGKLKATDRDDVNKHIEGNLEEISFWAIEAAKGKSPGSTIPWDDVAKTIGVDALNRYMEAKSVNGEIYAKTEFTVLPGGKIKAVIYDGQKNQYLIER